MSRIVFIDGATGEEKEEKVYGESFVRFAYTNPLGKVLGRVAAKAFFSKLYGLYQDSPLSKGKVAPFIEKFSIPMEEFLPTEGRSPQDPYGSFNEFFTRRFRPGAREFCAGGNLPAPCEGRYLVYPRIHGEMNFPVKGDDLSFPHLFANERWARVFEGGPLFIARLCPVDYHRFHFPDDGCTLGHYRIPGALHSVNPLALKTRKDVFIANERRVSILETAHFGKMALIEVGALCVGRIRQTHPTDKDFKRGEEKGMFLFGGSTVIGLGEKGRWGFDKSLEANTASCKETYLKLGQRIGTVSP
ncbi:MAG: phosphatidylserine decarboxylase [Bacteriovoracales bacterium]|nr:phosphatidylserine decarboxylase [Bacteriovoracales bacterium]